MQALMLAAGMGRRLGRHTQTITKCMLEVGGKTLIERTADALKEAGIHRFVIVVGWEGEKLIQFIQTHITDMEFEFVYNKDYADTNNIYSLYMAREQLAQDDTILLESDLVYDKELIRKMVEAPQKNLVAVAKYEQWMDGTVTTLTPEGYIQDFVEKKNFSYQDAGTYYKTVNIYKFSKEFSETQYLPFLEAYIRAYGRNQYYEAVLKAIAHIANAQLKAYILNGVKWYEIDDAQDLDIANTMFAPGDRRLSAYELHYGGYWRFPELKDFCYLVNPYFPPEKMKEQIKFFYDSLLTQYPSGMNIQQLIAGKTFKVNEKYLLVGNGAAELINMLGQNIAGNMVVSKPSFNEYVRCFRRCKIISRCTAKNGFRVDCESLCDGLSADDTVVIINPDNPSGMFVEKDTILKLLEECKFKRIRCIVDESFIDFAEKELRYTLLDDGVLERYPNLVVIKSLSKSYGVPGLRLGILATTDKNLLGQIKGSLPIWNINSYAEYFLQIYALYASQYENACDQIVEQRRWLSDRLAEFPFLKVFPSQANYIMCAVKSPYGSKELATYLLRHHNLLIKDLSKKDGFDGQSFIRLAVKDQRENSALIEALDGFNQRNVRGRDCEHYENHLCH